MTTPVVNHLLSVWAIWRENSHPTVSQNLPTSADLRAVYHLSLLTPWLGVITFVSGGHAAHGLCSSRSQKNKGTGKVRRSCLRWDNCRRVGGHQRGGWRKTLQSSVENRSHLNWASLICSTGIKVSRFAFFFFFKSITYFIEHTVFIIPFCIK